MGFLFTRFRNYFRIPPTDQWERPEPPLYTENRAIGNLQGMLLQRQPVTVGKVSWMIFLRPLRVSAHCG